MLKVADNYTLIEKGSQSTGGFDVWHSDALMDVAWDEALEKSAAGQFQQASMWAGFKAMDGWRPARYLFGGSGIAVGGVQILWRKSKFGKLGYASKGPVLFEGSSGEYVGALRAAVFAARRLGLTGLVIQSPDYSQPSESDYWSTGFIRERTVEVIESSLWFDLSGAEQDLWGRMPGYNRTFIRQAQRRGVAVREGTEADLGIFFDLMLQTCARQESPPHPSSEALLREVWAMFSKRSSIRLTLAEVEGRVVAALISIGFGRRLTLWKKGWTNDKSQCRPNHLLYFETLKWAQERGFEFCDFYSVRRDIAEALIAGRELNEEQVASRDRFHLGFGGKPRLLNRSMIWFPNPMYRSGYELMTRVSTFWRRFRSRGPVAVRAGEKGND